VIKELRRVLIITTRGVPRKVVYLYIWLAQDGSYLEPRGLSMNAG